MKRKLFLVLLCSLSFSQAVICNASGREENRAETAAETDFSEFIMTQQPFLSFDGMEVNESRSQVFTIWNRQEVLCTYTLKLKAKGEISIELEKKGDFFYEGKIGEKSSENDENLFLTELNPGETIVFSLTLSNGGEERSDAEVCFLESQNLSCDKK